MEVKELNISVHSDDINKNFVQEIDQIFNKNTKGNCRLKFTINSENNGEAFSLELLAREKNIDLTNELINTLENLPYINYKIIK